jgi:hypothetical protein
MHQHVYLPYRKYLPCAPNQEDNVSNKFHHVIMELLFVRSYFKKKCFSVVESSAAASTLDSCGDTISFQTHHWLCHSLFLVSAGYLSIFA